MTSTPRPPLAGRPDGSFEFHVVALPAAWRVTTAALVVVSRGSLLAILAAVLLSENPPTNPFKQMRLLAGFFVAPEIAAWCIAKAFAASARVSGGVLTIARRDANVEVPLDAVTAIEPWAVPLPRGGVWLKLRSGRRLAWGLQAADPAGLVGAMVDCGAPPSLRAGLESPLVVFAQARLAWSLHWLDHPVLKFVVYSLVPAMPVFRLHQFITYGGTFGEYYTFGLKAYLLGFGLWWVSFAMGLLMFAAAIRAVVEVLAMLAAVLAPARATGARRLLEWGQRIAFYVGIPTWMALRLLA